MCPHFHIIFFDQNSIQNFSLDEHFTSIDDILSVKTGILVFGVYPQILSTILSCIFRL